MSGAAAMPPVVRDCGLPILAFDPGLLGLVEDYKARVAAYAEALRGTRPIDPAHKVRLPFERSAAKRTRRLAANRIEVANPVYQTLRHVSRVAG